MRIGLISDIHGNVEALEASLAALQTAGVDLIACLGDIVGYGGQPDECCTRVREVADITVLGNHDAAVSGRMDYSYYRAAAREALDAHAARLSPENMAWLRGLPFIHRRGDLAFCHGSPVSLEEFDYIFVLDQMHDLVAQYESQAAVTFIGHSHLCKCFAFDDLGAEEMLQTRFTLDADRKYVITAGSVGQPRDYDPRSCCGLYDTETRQFQYLRTAYDIEAAARKIFDAGLSVTFGKRLFLGV
jgi:predicted phosphodiesterase